MTKTERLILINQYEILNKLNNNHSYNFDIEILRGGYVGLYNELSSMDEKETPKEVYFEVQNILSMFRTINYSVEKLSDSEKLGLNLNRLKFNGFDGNSDEGHYGILNCMIDNGDRWQEIKETNSHSAMSLSRYLDMLNYFDLLEKNIDFYLNFEQLQKLSEII
jgi:hypothetical protein